MSIGGPIDYTRLAQLHRPSDHAVLAEEVTRLARSGLSPADISVALRIDLIQVRRMIAATGDEAAQLHREAWR